MCKHLSEELFGICATMRYVLGTSLSKRQKLHDNLHIFNHQFRKTIPEKGWCKLQEVNMMAGSVYPQRSPLKFESDNVIVVKPENNVWARQGKGLRLVPHIIT